jgi:hypothetical protein
MRNTEAQTRIILEALKKSIPELDRGMALVAGKRQIVFLDIDEGDWFLVRLPHGNRRRRRLPGVFSAPGNTKYDQIAEKIWAIWPEIISTVAA